MDSSTTFVAGRKSESMVHHSKLRNFPKTQNVQKFNFRHFHSEGAVFHSKSRSQFRSVNRKGTTLRFADLEQGSTQAVYWSDF